MILIRCVRPPIRRCSIQALLCTRIPQPQPKKYFCSTSSRQLTTAELTPLILSSLRANSQRLWNDIHQTAQFGIGNRYGDGEHETGLNRLALTHDDKLAREWFASTTRSLGCSLYTDQIGNQFAIRPGQTSHPHSQSTTNNDTDNDTDASKPHNEIPATFAGSHLDSQPQGGRFDGVLGVCSGIEMLRVLNENWIETAGPVGVVNWTNEEGKRWRRSMMGSGVWAEPDSLSKVLELGDEDGGRSVKSELEGIGYNGGVKASWEDGMRMAGHFEVHIEQARRLERKEEKVAVVSGAQGYKWFTITAKGVEAHAGATPWEDRTDAGLWAMEAVTSLVTKIKKCGGLATVGCFEVSPGSVNVVPGGARFTVDIRHEDQKELEELCGRFMIDILQSHKGRLKSETGNVIDFEVKLDFESKAMQFDETAMGCIEESAKSVTGKEEITRLVSGAGHDSVNTAKHCPTAMIFVPCRDGITHNIKEWCSEEDCAIGASVLLQSVLKFDKWRHEHGDLQEERFQSP